MDLKSKSKSCILANLLKTEIFLAIRKIALKLSFLILNTILYFLMLMNTSRFHLLNWQGVGQSRPSPFLLFTLDYLSEHSHSHTSLILHIARNLPCYLHFAFCLFVWLIKLKCTPCSSHH